MKSKHRFFKSELHFQVLQSPSKILSNYYSRRSFFLWRSYLPLFKWRRQTRTLKNLARTCVRPDINKGWSWTVFLEENLHRTSRKNKLERKARTLKTTEGASLVSSCFFGNNTSWNIQHISLRNLLWLKRWSSWPISANPLQDMELSRVTSKKIIKNESGWRWRTSWLIHLF